MDTQKGSYTNGKRAALARISDVRTRVARLFDRSIAVRMADILRRRFLALSTKALGVFFLTLGAYAFIISLMLTLFTDRSPDASAIYGGLLTAISSLPLLFSKGNVTTLLKFSRAGEVICDHLSIRTEALRDHVPGGHLSIGFTAGVIASLATLFIPYRTVMLILFLFLAACIIMCSPESGLAFSLLFLFTADIRLQYLVILVTMISYAVKLIRGKRTLRMGRSDILIALFALCTLGAVFFVSEGKGDAKNLRYVFLIIPYFLTVCLSADCRNIKKTMSAATSLAGLIAALYCLGFALRALIPTDIAVDPSFLISKISGLPLFESGAAPFVFASLIPVCFAFIMKPRSDGNRFTILLCLISMVSALMLTEELAFLAAATIATVVLLLSTGSKRIYFILTVVLAVCIVTSLAGSVGDTITAYVTDHIREAYSQAENTFAFSKAPVSSEFLFSGRGFGDGGSDAGFIYSLLSRLGLCSLLILAVFFLFLIADAGHLIRTTRRQSASSDCLARFASTSNPSETRMGMIAVLSALLSAALCATFFDLYSRELSYLWFFILCGVCSAYAENSRREIAKAESSLSFDVGCDRAFAILEKDR